MIDRTRGPGAISTRVAEGSEPQSVYVFRSDVALLIWFFVSYAALSIGGRFFAQYFFQILPSLCLIGARGLIGIHSSLKQSKRIHRAATAVVIVGLAITVLRSHTRTVYLALEFARGTRSERFTQWYHERLNREDRMVAATVRDLPDTAEASDLRYAEALRADGPRTRGVRDQSDYLFVWGARAEIYFWSGLLPASRYLSTQALTGVPTDVQRDGAAHNLTDESANAAARIELLGDLEKTRPKYILDEIGFSNAELSIERYPEFREFLSDYKRIGVVGELIVYRNREQQKRDRLTKGG